MSYYQKQDRLTNEHGDGLRGFRVRVLDSSGAVQAIYGDKGGTPIIMTSGFPDTAVVDALGNYTFYATAGTYTLEFSDPLGVYFASQGDVQIGLTGVNPDDLAAVAAVAGDFEDVAESLANVNVVGNDLTLADGQSYIKRVASGVLDLQAVDAVAANVAVIQADVTAKQGLVTTTLQRVQTIANTGVGRVLAMWSDLSAVTGMAANDGAIVLDADTGTHASLAGDNGASGGQTPNAGVYRYVTGTGWVRASASTAAQVAATGALLNGVYSQVSTLPGYALVRNISGVVTELIPSNGGPRQYPSSPLDRASVDGFSRDFVPSVVSALLGSDGSVLSYRLADGRRVEVAGGQSNGLPAVGNNGDLLVNDPAAVGGAKWAAAYKALGSPLFDVIAAGIDTVSPARQVGVTSGNAITDPQACIGRGASIDKWALGANRADGAGVIRIFSRITGKLIEEHVVRVGTEHDDHNPAAVVCFADGTFAAFAAGHNDDGLTKTSFRAPDGTWSDGQLGWSGTTTYPRAYIDKNDKLWFFIRTGDKNWSLRTRDGPTSPWSSTAIIYTTCTSKYYSQVSYNEAEHCFEIFLRASAEYSGQPAGIRLIRLDCATGEFFDANGGLGKIDGSASANGKALPVAYNDVPLLAPPPTGGDLGVLDCTRDGRSLLIQTTKDSDIDYVALSIWQRTGNNPFDINSYTQYPAFLLEGGRIAYGTNNNSPGARFGLEPHAGYRVYAGVKGPSPDFIYRIERWDCPSSDGVTWTNKVIATGAPGEIICRPMSPVGSNGHDAIPYARFATFTEFNVYSGEEVRFTRGADA